MTERVDIFMDTEFDNGPHGLTLISVGMVNGKGDSYYAVSNAFNDASCSRYVQRKVITRLADQPRIDPLAIREGITQFVGKSRPAFWGYCPAFDWVLMSVLWKGLDNMPHKWPKYCLCVRQLAMDHNIPSSAFPPKPDIPHHALDDAFWARECHGSLMDRLGKTAALVRRSDTST